MDLDGDVEQTPKAVATVADKSRMNSGADGEQTACAGNAKRNSSATDLSDLSVASPEKHQRQDSSGDEAEHNDTAEVDLGALGDEDSKLDATNEFDFSHLSEDSDDDEASGADNNTDKFKELDQWRPGANDVFVRAQLVRVKLDIAEGKRSGKPAYNILVEDKSDSTIVCSFGDNALRLKQKVNDKIGRELLFSNLCARKPAEAFKKNLPGNLPFELYFERGSDVDPPKQRSQPQIIEKMSELTSQLGVQEVDITVVVCSKFANIMPSYNAPSYRGQVSDGVHIVELEVLFAPHFKAGQELRLLRLLPRYDAETMRLTVYNAADMEVISDKNKYSITRDKLQLKRLHKK